VSYELPANRVLDGHTGFSELVAAARDTVVVASPRAATGLRIFRGTSGALTQVASFEPFGGVFLLHTSLAVSEDDVAVGMPRPVHEQDTTASEMPDESIVHMYRRTAAGWMDASVITPPASAASGHFGHSVAMDGRTLAVGAPNANGGAVYVYVLDAKGWQLDAELVGVASPMDRFGWSVAVAGDALVVGAPGNNGAQRGASRAGPRSRRATLFA
jgi:hypothetical protein